MGAEVIKIESPKRMDYVRMSGVQVDGASVLFHQLNHNKTLKMVDYSTPSGKQEILDLIQGADAVIEQFRPGAMAAWGFGYEQLKAQFPGLVYVSITGYGQNNDYAQEAGHDFNYMAYSGMMSLLKDEQGKPLVPDTQFADIAGSYMAVMALQAALLQKSKSGKGSFVDVSLADAINPFLILPYSLHKGGLDQRQVNLINGTTTVNYAAYQCADGKWLAVAAMEIKFWNNICDLIDKADWKRKHELELTLANFNKQEVIDFFKSKDRDEWMQLFQGKDTCVSPILELEELEQHPYHQQKNTFENFETPNGTPLNTVALPFNVKT